MLQKKLFTLTKNDFEWDYVRGSGKGGQKRNKTSSAVRCRHIESGAIGYSEDTRSQSKNRMIAFRRCCESKKFKSWVNIEASKITGELIEIERKIERELKDKTKTKIEVKDGEGKWINV